ncbi:hypothetical protein BDZ91DRAFT_853773 [Kalaharituber pfeilii]|nr:hypothetical protein BDZ91DRAFT_853773 [Kalaharituber pfeilii]
MNDTCGRLEFTMNDQASPAPPSPPPPPPPLPPPPPPLLGLSPITCIQSELARASSCRSLVGAGGSEPHHVHSVGATGTCLQYQEEVITEAGLKQQAKADRAEERNRLGLSYRPLQRLGHKTATLAGIIGGKGLRAWKHRMGTADSPDCRWCGEEAETTQHILTNCRVWKQKCPRGIDDLRHPKTDKDEDRDKLWELMDWAGR